ncbi:hypothetical protein [Streptomyces sp. NPDC005438]|uniref:hypothetical protein n=1 Tax=Streptomyces sp. NPDC005438 TaxID=3156880 RepID=UPI0033A8A6E0
MFNATVTAPAPRTETAPLSPLRCLQLVAAALEPTPDVLRYRAALAALVDPRGGTR